MIELYGGKEMRLREKRLRLGQMESGGVVGSKIVGGPEDKGGGGPSMGEVEEAIGQPVEAGEDPLGRIVDAGRAFVVDGPVAFQFVVEGPIVRLRERELERKKGVIV